MLFNRHVLPILGKINIARYCRGQPVIIYKKPFGNCIPILGRDDLELVWSVFCSGKGAERFSRGVLLNRGTHRICTFIPGRLSYFRRLLASSTIDINITEIA